VRPVDWVLCIYFTYTSILGLVLPVASEIRVRTLVVNIGVIGTLALLSRASRLHWAKVTRDWYALALVLLGYKEMGWFAPAAHTYRLEHLWIVWDNLLLGQLHFKEFVEILGPIGPGLLELSYLLVYAVGPFCLVLLLAFKRHESIGAFLLAYVLGLFLSYGQFPFWPSEPPRTVFPGDFEPVPTLVREANLFLVGNAGIHTSVFPSGHVSGVFAAALMMWTIFPDKPRLRLGLMIYAVLVAVATFYGRYHYVVDALAGLAVGFAAFWLARAWTSYENGWNSAPPIR
jgi:membrane-associated phospholipid phosphatase